MNGYPRAALRGCRIALHLIYAMLLALRYPHLDRATQRRVLMRWSRKLLDILGIRIAEEGLHHLPATGCVLAANRVSWLDCFVLNAIQPTHFVASTAARNLPLLGWLCKHSGTLSPDRTLHRNAAALLRAGECIGLFPDAVATKSDEVGHFRSAALQAAIDTGAALCPVALRYLDAAGTPSTVPASGGGIALTQSLWRILRCRRIEALLIFSPALPAHGANRRMLAWTAQESITRNLQAAPPKREKQMDPPPHIPAPLFSPQSSYVLLLAPVIDHFPR